MYLSPQSWYLHAQNWQQVSVRVGYFKHAGVVGQLQKRRYFRHCVIDAADALQSSAELNCTMRPRKWMQHITIPVT